MKRKPLTATELRKRAPLAAKMLADVLEASGAHLVRCPDHKHGGATSCPRGGATSCPRGGAALQIWQRKQWGDS